jgi:MFS transporter, ACS family, glucarate transporter
MASDIVARRVLTRVVLWWSAFTAFTGMTSNYYVLLFTRFCFGAGEAGALPDIGVSMAGRFPIIEGAPRDSYSCSCKSVEPSPR